MNKSQLAIKQHENAKQETGEEVPTHGYHISKRPVNHTELVSITQTEHVTGVEGNIAKIHPKTHTHVMLTQVNVKQGLIKYREKGN